MEIKVIEQVVYTPEELQLMLANSLEQKYWGSIDALVYLYLKTIPRKVTSSQMAAYLSKFLAFVPAEDVYILGDAPPKSKPSDVGIYARDNVRIILSKSDGSKPYMTLLTLQGVNLAKIVIVDLAAQLRRNQRLRSRYIVYRNAYMKSHADAYKKLLGGDPAPIDMLPHFYKLLKYFAINHMSDGLYYDMTEEIRLPRYDTKISGEVWVSEICKQLGKLGIFDHVGSFDGIIELLQYCRIKSITMDMILEMSNIATAGSGSETDKEKQVHVAIGRVAKVIEERQNHKQSMEDYVRSLLPELLSRYCYIRKFGMAKFKEIQFAAYRTDCSEYPGTRGTLLDLISDAEREIVVSMMRIFSLAPEVSTHHNFQSEAHKLLTAIASSNDESQFRDFAARLKARLSLAEFPSPGLEVPDTWYEVDGIPVICPHLVLMINDLMIATQENPDVRANADKKKCIEKFGVESDYIYCRICGDILDSKRIELIGLRESAFYGRKNPELYGFVIRIVSRIVGSSVVINMQDTTPLVRDIVENILPFIERIERHFAKVKTMRSVDVENQKAMYSIIYTYAQLMILIGRFPELISFRDGKADIVKCAERIMFYNVGLFRNMPEVNAEFLQNAIGIAINKLKVQGLTIDKGHVEKIPIALIYQAFTYFRHIHGDKEEANWDNIADSKDPVLPILSTMIGHLYRLMKKHVNESSPELLELEIAFNASLTKFRAVDIFTAGVIAPRIWKFITDAVDVNLIYGIKPAFHRHVWGYMIAGSADILSAAEAGSRLAAKSGEASSVCKICKAVRSQIHINSRTEITGDIISNKNQVALLTFFQILCPETSNRHVLESGVCINCGYKAFTVESPEFIKYYDKYWEIFDRLSRNRVVIAATKREEYVDTYVAPQDEFKFRVNDFIVKYYTLLSQGSSIRGGIRGIKYSKAEFATFMNWFGMYEGQVISRIIKGDIKIANNYPMRLIRCYKYIDMIIVELIKMQNYGNNRQLDPNMQMIIDAMQGKVPNIPDIRTQKIPYTYAQIRDIVYRTEDEQVASDMIFTYLLNLLDYIHGKLGDEFVIYLWNLIMEAELKTSIVQEISSEFREDSGNDNLVDNDVTTVDDILVKKGDRDIFRYDFDSGRASLTDQNF